MTSLPNHVSNLILSQKLKELGVKQESLFHWRVYPDGKAELDYGVPARTPILDDIHGGYPSFYSAFTSSELGEMLPASIHGFETYAGLKLVKTDGNFWTASYEDFDGKVHVEKSEYSLANAMAYLLIHLLENGLLKN